MGTILVVEDEAGIRDEIMEMLHYEHWNTIGAENGRIGVELAQQHLPDLIFCDIMMPVQDGYTTLAQLRGSVATATIPFVFLTAKSDRRDWRKGMELGADDYLIKPFTIEELLNSIQTQLKRQRLWHTRLMQNLDTLHSNVSQAFTHELLTPLNGILGFSQFLQSEYSTLHRSEIGEIVHYIHGSGDRLYKLIQNILLITQLELSQKELPSVKPDTAENTKNPAKLIMRVLQEQAKIHERSEDLRMDLEDAPLTISQEDLQKIVEELGNNAFKFSESKTPVHVVAAVSNRMYTLQFIDQGRGMTAEQISNIGPYMQFERQQYQQTGLGLGLILAKRLTEWHGGHFFLESQSHQQTRVCVTFPCEESLV